ncbi:MAG: AAA family ATPase, partial [Sarcina sp.]|nr:AAA family ATPase [Sarcina sp.]
EKRRKTMKLISCHIENFGRLHRLDCSFSDGLNMICRENGWGKSTFAAFLCAMLYGLPAARKKSPEDNERHRYRPWQGGAYGGRLTFEAYGKRYEITRMFGSRESEDEFELRDLDTNIPCFDYSTGIGEELFCMDRDSFVRTVYTRQQDCVTAATDDINALIGNLTDTAGDMGCYEDAMKRLHEAANRLSPKRQTGSIRRREEEIKRLEREASASEEIREQTRKFSERHQGALREAASLEAELRDLEAQMERIRQKEENARLKAEKESAAAGERQIRDRLLRTLEQRREKAARAASLFPGRIPSREEVEECLKKCRQMERLEDRMEGMMLSEEEQNRLNELEEICENSGGPDRPDSFAEGPGRPDGFAEGPEKELRGTMAAAVFAAVGAVLLLSGIAVLVFAPHSPGEFPAFRLAGALIAAAGLLSAAGAADLFYRKSFSRHSSKHVSRLFSDRASEPGRNPAGRRTEALSSGDNIEREYRILLEKERKLEELHAKWAEARRPVAAFLLEAGVSPKEISLEEDLRTQLEFLRETADDYEDACSLVREAEEDLRGFEEELAAKTCRQNPDQEQPEGQDWPGNYVLPGDSAEMRARADRIHAKLLKSREAAAEYSHVLEELRTEQEEQETALQRLSALKKKQEEDRAKYSRVTRAAALLQKAREAMTARYADPIRESFSGYWEMITGLSSEGIRVDANAAVTVEEMGRQRDTDLLSAGYRDLAGLCLRFALADAMYQGRQRECPPLILDDPFTNLDDAKTAGALQLLQEAAGKYQIIYFTCSSSRC